MILPVKTSLRFSRLFSLLCVYAHYRLHIVTDAEFFNEEPPRGISLTGERLTTNALWEDIGLVDDYVRENPDRLSADDLATVRSWTNAYTCITCIIRCDDGKVRFLVDDYAVEVWGISKDIPSALPQLPVLAHTTLLPYDDYVVYDQTLEQLGVDPSPSVLEVFEKGMEEALQAGRVIRTGQEFCEMVPQMRRRREESELERFRRDMEMEERAHGELAGQHRGALAGLSGEEREEAIQCHMRELDEQRSDDASNRLALRVKECLPGEPVFGLRELMEAHVNKMYDTMLASTEELEKDFRELGNRGADALKRTLAMKEKLGDASAKMRVVEDCVEQYQDPYYLQEVVNGLSRPQISRMRALAEEGGYHTCADDPLPSSDEMPVAVEGLCFLFHTEGMFHVVMPREVVPLARELDWDEAFAHERYLRRLSAFFECLTDLRGIVQVDEAIDEFKRDFDEGDHSPDEVYETLLDCMEEDRVSSVLLATDEDEYLLHYELFAMYQEQRGEEPYGDKYLVEGPLTDLLEGLLQIQRGKKPRSITEEMLEFGSVFDWKQAQPPAIALQTYLDEHVPDDADDFFFAERVMKDLLYEQMFGIIKHSVDYFFKALEDHGFVPDECQVQTLLNLWQNMCNGLPIWPNNGWSPNEVMEHMQGGRRGTGRPVFYNPDGSIMKVGRNDPCPCGSGKKYKRCCGR